MGFRQLVDAISNNEGLEAKDANSNDEGAKIKKFSESSVLQKYFALQSKNKNQFKTSKAQKS